MRDDLGNLPAKAIDPLKASLNALLVIVFPATASKNYQMVLSIAHGASQYCEVTMSKSVTHLVVFSKTKEDAGRAVAILELVSGWKGAFFFVDGCISKQSWHIADVLKCYIKSTACDDPKAHCYEVIDDPVSKKPVTLGGLSINILATPPLKKEVVIDRYVFPCQYLLSRGFRFQVDHPSDFEKQIQAGAVFHGCHICPNCIPSEYKKNGEKIVLQNVFDNYN